MNLNDARGIHILKSYGIDIEKATSGISIEDQVLFYANKSLTQLNKNYLSKALPEDKYLSAVSLLDDIIIKAGAGSRGGKIIGYTKSGKPIYSNASSEKHMRFSIDDHNDAIDKHQEVRDKYRNNHNSTDKDKADNDNAYHQQKHHIAQKNRLVSEREASEKNNVEKSELFERIGEKGNFQYILKAGEGSRGGTVIGHTTTGKPIYDNENHSEHKSFNKKEKLEAADHHEKHTIERRLFENHFSRGVGAADNKMKRRRKELIQKIANHGKDENNVQKSYDALKQDILKSGEGSRGGKVIGHTKSGKPIYENADHESHKNFDYSDHVDASNEHKRLAYKYEEEKNSEDDRDKMTDKMNKENFHRKQMKNHADKIKNKY